MGGILRYLHLMELKTTPLRWAGVLLGTLGGGVPSGSPNPHPISDKNVIFHTRFQTLPSGRNDLNLFGIFLLLSNSFRIETINTFIHSVVPSKTIPDSRPKWTKCITVFRPNRRKNPTRWFGTYLYSLYKGVPPPRVAIACGNSCLPDRDRKWPGYWQTLLLTNARTNR